MNFMLSYVHDTACTRKGPEFNTIIIKKCNILMQVIYN